MSKPQQICLSFTLEAELDGEQLTNVVNDIRFLGAAREAEIGNRLVSMARWSLREYQQHRWEAWEDAEKAGEAG